MHTDIIPLSEGMFTIGYDKIFVPFDEQHDHLNDRPRGSLLVEIQPFVVRVQEKIILFDTGLGFALPGGEMQLFANLRRNGIDPLDVNLVLLSHLHKDHAGGVSYSDSLGIQHLSFPNARYIVHKSEFEFGLERGSPSYHTDDFDILMHSPQVEWLQDKKGTLDGFIHYEQDGGHCPFHTSFLIDDAHPIFYGGDVVPQLKQLKTRYMAKYDADSRRSMELRQEYAERGLHQHWTFLFYHDVKIPFATL